MEQCTTFTPMAVVRLPLAVDLTITQFAGASITRFDRGMVNAIVDKRGDRLCVTQRPGIDVFEAQDLSVTFELEDGDIILALAVGNGVLVAYTPTSGKLFKSEDGGDTWSEVVHDISADLVFCLAYGAGVWVAGGTKSGAAYLATSPDLETWTERTSNMTGATSVYDVTYGGGLFVAVGTGSSAGSGRIATSPNGETWTAGTIPSDARPRAVSYGGGVWVAYGHRNDGESPYDPNAVSALIASPNGTSWSRVSGGPPGEWFARVAYGNGVWVASSERGVYSATDPFGTWDQRLPNSDKRGLVFGGIWLSFGRTVHASEDGFSWFEQTSPFTDDNAGNSATSSVLQAVYNNGRIIATTREAGKAFAIADVASTDIVGRAAFYWDAAAALYFVAGGTVYRGSYSVPIGDISNGTNRCYFGVLGEKLILTDPGNGEGWTIDIANTLAKVTDTDFPPNQTPSVPLAHGLAILNGRAYVLGADGTIYGSELEDATTWDALNFITAERDPDGGTFIGRHHDHIVAMGPRTIEVFYDAANSVGSPLSRRQDIAYNLGCNSGESVWVNGDRIWFIGVDPSGMLGVYVMESFRPRKVSSGTFDSYLTTAITREGCRAIGSGVTASGRSFYLLTILSDDKPVTTLVYDDAAGLWGCWEVESGPFPLVSWSIRTSVLPRFGEGIMYDGRLFTLSDSLAPFDSVRGSNYAAEDYFAEDYALVTASSGAQFPMKVRLGQNDFGTDSKKFLSQLRVIADRTEESVPCGVSWADERTGEFTSKRVVDLSTYQALHRLGSCRRRNFAVEVDAHEQVWLEALEVTTEVGR